MKWIVFFVVGLVAASVTPAFAQKSGDPNGAVGIFNSQAEYSQFMGGVKRLAYGDGGSPELQSMIPMLNDIVLNRPVGSTSSQYQTSGMTLGLLADSRVREEIEMLDDQYKQIQEANREIQQRSAEALKSLDLSDSENLIQQISEIRKRANEELNAVLLPKQLQRLRQLQMQALLRRQSFVDLLTNDPVKSKVEISDQQAEKLREAAKKIEQDLRLEIAKLQAKARERLIGQLDPKQQAEVKDLMGDSFEFGPPAKGANKRPAKNKRKSGYQGK